MGTAILTIVAALVPLVVALAEAWVQRAPGRRRAEHTEGYRDDLTRMDAALADQDPDTIAALFEDERRAGLERAAPGRVQHEPDGAERRPDDRAAS